jgi:hypothetical protein
MGDYLVGEHWVLGVHQRKGVYMLQAVITKVNPSKNEEQSQTHACAHVLTHTI